MHSDPRCLFFSVNCVSPWSCLRNIVIKSSLTNAINIFQHILPAFLKVVSLNLLLTFLHFLDVTIFHESALHLVYVCKAHETKKKT